MAKSRYAVIKLLLLIAAFAVPTTAYSSKYMVSKARNMEGLSNNSVLCLYQDHKGVMWFGSYDGLNRYTSNDVKVTRVELGNPHSISSNIIQLITYAGDDKIWLLSPLALDLYDTNSGKVVKKFMDITSSWSLASDENGNTFASIGSKVMFYNRTMGEFVEMKCDDLPKANVQSLFVCDNNTLWILETSGKLRKLKYMHKDGEIDSDSFSLIDIPVHEKYIYRAFLVKSKLYLWDESNCLYSYDTNYYHKTLVCDMSNIISRNSVLTSIEEIADGVLLSFIGEGTFKIRSDNQEVEHLVEDVGVFAMASDKRQPIVWICTDGGGVRIYNSNESQFKQILSSQISKQINKPIRALYSDKYNRLWIGTKGNGIVRVKNYEQYANGTDINSSDIETLGVSDGLLDDQVFNIERSLCHDDLLWITSRGPGINYYTFSDNKIHSLQHPMLRIINEIYEENDSVLWLASSIYGVVRLSIEKNGEQLSIKSCKNYVFKRGEYLCSEVYSFVPDGMGSLYVGCRGGLGVAKFDLKTSEYSFLLSDVSAMGDVICMLQLNDSVMFYGASSGMGRIKLNNLGSLITTYDHSKGMRNDMVHSMLAEEDGNVWLATNKGLTKFMVRTQEFHNFQNYNSEIVEFCDNASHRCIYTGRLLFGGINGVLWVDPNTSDANTYMPEISFIDIKIDGEERNLHDYIDENGRLVLENNQNTFSISFVALDYVNSGTIEYSYRLDGYNEGWVYRGNEGSAGFLNLPYGKYKLYVRYFNGVSERKEHYNVLEIEVKAPWYLTSWAIMLYVLLFILICCIAIRIFFAIYHRKQVQLAARIREQQQEQQFKDRLEFFTNITHEFCTPLTIIQGVCDILKKKNEGNADMGKYVETLHTNTSHLNTLVQELLDFRQIEEGAFRKINIRMAPIDSIIRRWSSSYEEIAANNDIRFSVSVVPQDLLWSTDTSCLGKILTNLISNAFKYTPVGGEVRISAEVFNDHLHISVYNTGMGMSEEEKKSIFNRYEILNDMSRNGYRDMSERHGLGLAICQKMVEILNGTITVDSVKGEYARFEVVLPLLKPKQNDAAALESADEKMPVVDLPENATPKIMLSETKLKMLVVDDNKEILGFYKDLLSDEYSISSATSVGEAMHQIETNQPNIIITDIMMPDQSGVDFIGMVRGNRYTEHIPIIVVSAKVRETDQVEGIEKGADAYITKPFSGAVLKSMVKRIVDRERSARNYYTSPESAYIKHEGMLISNADKEFLDSVLKIISENIEDEDALRPAEIASKLGIDPRTLYRKFKKISPLTPNDFVKNYRYNLATKLLRTTDLSIQEIIYKVGVSNKTSFYADFKKLYGMTPTEYRNQKE